MKKIQKLLASALLVLLTIACTEDDTLAPDPNEGMTAFASQAIPESDMTIRMFIAEGQKIEVGYNAFSLAVFDASGQHMKNTHITMKPMMTMMEMTHSAPHETHEHALGSDEYQRFAAVFVMPTREMGSWALEIDVHDMDTEFSGSVSIPVTVAEPEHSKMEIKDMGEAGNLFISLVSPDDPKVGVNDFEITIHERETGMSWPAMEDYTITIEPEMPAMGHGSPNNINPVHNEMGHYKGSVNFTMTGEWLIYVTINSGNDLITETEFTVTF